jgi:hypothetical protein
MAEPVIGRRVRKEPWREAIKRRDNGEDTPAFRPWRVTPSCVDDRRVRLYARGAPAKKQVGGM